MNEAQVLETFQMNLEVLWTKYTPNKMEKMYRYGTYLDQTWTTKPHLQ
jgi:hypothetical protein